MTAHADVESVFRTYQLLYMHKLCIEQMRKVMAMRLSSGITIAAQHFAVLCRLKVSLRRMG
jgi:hypothetical protein